MNAPVRSSHLFEQIHEILWGKILQGEIEPTQRLKDVEWAAKLGVSRTPVREAMRKMQQEGILIPLNQGGYEVRSVTMTDLHDLYRCRSALEVQAVREAAEHFGPKVAKHFTSLIRMTDQAIERNDLDRVLALNSEFHRDLIEQSGNVHLPGLCETIRKLTLFYRTALLNRAKADARRKKDYVQRLKAKQKEHRAIIKALTEQDGEKAASLMQSHLLQTAQHMELES
ncbi:GntR family transcriptional regulator [Pelagibius litoralis]|uniref:GntR family transcriptional regulator n=1 Tax=Pelagibius litoralis TaxID=374515 RepID=A0A967K9D8_9PROT|nr:GntR family transcriptional regulator [Pelagibius litoralis]NIA70978.1 GntR family transcriptional regulator [Pelagibius litoralis]